MNNSAPVLSMSLNMVSPDRRLDTILKLTSSADFSGASNSLHCRPSFGADLVLIIMLKVLGMPLLIQALSWEFVYVNLIYRYQTFPGFMEWLCVTTRFVLIFGPWFWPSNIQGLEFDAWLADLYDQKVSMRSHTFYIHPRRWAVCGLLALGLVSGYVLESKKQLPNIFRPIAVFSVTEAAILPIGWIIEVYAHLPRVVNIFEWWLMGLEVSPGTQAHFFYQQYFAKSYLSTQAEHLAAASITAAHFWLSAIMPNGRADHTDFPTSNPTVPPESSTNRKHYSLAQCDSANAIEGMEPWATKLRTKFEASSVHCK